MSTFNGWGLTARLIEKHFGNMGSKIAEAIASFDPETATEADRENLSGQLQEAANKLAQARESFKSEHADVVALKKLIETDEAAMEVLAERLKAGTIAEATVNLFCDELEANKAKLDVEIAQEEQAKEFMEEVQKIVDALSERLRQFDENANKIKAQLKMAEAQKSLQSMRIDRQAELNSLSGLQASSSALDALSKRAKKVQNEAEGLKIVADINQKPLDQKEEIDAIRKSVTNGNASQETTLQRIQRLAGEKKSA